MFDGGSPPERTEDVVVELRDYTARVRVRGGLLMDAQAVAMRAAEKAVGDLERRELVFTHPRPWDLLDGGVAFAYKGRRQIAQWSLAAATPDDPKGAGSIWRDAATWGIVIPSRLANRGTVRIELRTPEHGVVGEIEADTKVSGGGPFYLEIPVPDGTAPPAENWEEFLLIERSHGLPLRVQRKPMMDDADVRQVVERFKPHFEKEVRRQERAALAAQMGVDERELAVVVERLPTLERGAQ